MGSARARPRPPQKLPDFLKIVPDYFQILPDYFPKVREYLYTFRNQTHTLSGTKITNNVKIIPFRSFLVVLFKKNG